MSFRSCPRPRSRPPAVEVPRPFLCCMTRVFFSSFFARPLPSNPFLRSVHSDVILRKSVETSGLQKYIPANISGRCVFYLTLDAVVPCIRRRTRTLPSTEGVRTSPTAEILMKLMEKCRTFAFLRYFVAFQAYFSMNRRRLQKTFKEEASMRLVKLQSVFNGR